ncbi:MAG: sulfite exporter TauE/SafE family protein [Pseudomonadota bacterium]
MDFGVSTGELWVIAGWLIAGGCLTGFMVGLLGVGGGGVMVPVLYEVFSILEVDESYRMQMTVGTALAVMIPTSLRSFMAHAKHAAVDCWVLRRLALPVMLGVLVGSVIAKYSHSDVLKWVWVVCSLLLALKMLSGRSEWQLGDAIPSSRILEIYGVGVGVVSSLMSIGGGAFVTIMMTLYGRTMQQAVATASGFGPIVAFPGVVGFAWAGWDRVGLPPGSIGYVSLIGALLMVSASILTAPLGARVAHGISRRALELAFGVFLLIVGTRFFLSLVL